MDTIEFRCPIHGVIARRDFGNSSSTDEYEHCPVEDEDGTVCEWPLIIVFAQDQRVHRHGDRNRHSLTDLNIGR
jgi:hypothetical protein